MCGIAGYLDPTPRSSTEQEALVRGMTRTIAHRGPDDEGSWTDPSTGIALGSRRLAIQDLSVHGHQPMVSAGGRYVIAYNGEIYNAAELRRELQARGEAPRWRGHSDTEVLLAALECWGIAATLTRCNGMFAFALWDRVERALFLARDRFGEKPLYYGLQGKVLLFGSELKALAAHPAFAGELDRSALDGYMRRNFVPGPASIYAGIRKLPAATYLEVAYPAGDRAPVLREPQPYWSALQVALQARQAPLADEQGTRLQLRESLARAIQSRCVSDVPLGAFLSGGVDSSLIVALMQREASQPVRTFTISFDDPAYDESPYAEEVARHLGARHVTHRVTPREAADAIVHMPSLFDEPFADSSQIPTFLVSRVARRDVTVALTGDGGDELFGGYHRYFVGQRTWNRVAHLPRSVRHGFATVIESLAPSRWEALLRQLRRSPGGSRLRDFSGHRLHRLAMALRARSPRDMYEGIMSRDDEQIVHRENNTAPTTAFAAHWPASLTVAEAMMISDTLDVLVDDFLVKVDRASMGVSLETRAPFLDPEIYELAWRMPVAWKVGSDGGKFILRDVLSEFVPRHLFERPKQGFGIPIGPWLRGPLRDWAESLLDESVLRSGGLLDPRPIRRLWREHQAGTHDHQQQLWSVLVFQDWLRHQRRQPLSRAATVPRIEPSFGVTGIP
jgi:asparagine synthase (glutamine-hydrolysing)